MNLFFRPIVSAATNNAITAGNGQDYLHQSNFDLFNVTLHQQWLFTDDSQNSGLVEQGAAPHLILNRTSSYAIDVVGGVFADGKSLQTYPLSANPNQLWKWNGDPSGNNVIQGLGEEFVVDIPNGDPKADLQTFHPDGGQNQQWTSPGIDRLLFTAYKISCVASAPKVLDVPNGSQNAGTVIQQFTNPGVTCFNQFWRIWPSRGQASLDNIDQVESGTQVRIQSVCNGLFLRPQPIADNRASVEQAADTGGNDFIWSMTGDNNAGWKIESSLNPGLVLDIPNSSRDDHVQLQVFRDNGNANQRWLFQPQ
jgi:hypothetical protein